MDYHRNDAILNDLKNKLNLNLNVQDPSARLFVKNYFRTDSEIHVTKFDREDSLVAFGCANGSIHLYDLQKSDKTAFLQYQSSNQDLKVPCTSLRWLYSEKSVKMKSVLVSSNTDGNSLIQKKILFLKLGTITYKNVKNDQTVVQFKEEQDNEVYGMDLGKSELVTCGKDSKVRIYDVETQQLHTTLTSIQWMQPGHNNRLFSVKIVPYDRNIIISGGWDQNIVLWDVRTKGTIGCILGPKICGDAIDIREGIVLTGANRMSEQLQLWDMGSQKLIQDIKWDPATDNAGAFIYGAQFAKSKLNGAAGVSHGTNEFKYFDQTKGGFKGDIALKGFTKGLYALDFANLSNKCVIGGGDQIGVILALLPTKQ